MDFIVSYHLYNKIKKQELNELNGKMNIKMNIKTKEQPPLSRDRVFKTCERCGQDPYLCQCERNIKNMYLNFNAEKDNY